MSNLKNNKELLQRAREGDERAKAELMKNNEALVTFVLKRNFNPKFKCYYDDLFNAGRFGLYKAINSFDENKKASFGSYAITCIRNEILMFYRKNGKFLNDTSLDQEIGPNDKASNMGEYGATRLEFVASPDNEIDRVEGVCVVESVFKILEKHFTPLQIQVIKERFYCDEPATQLSIARKTGHSRSYISRVESNTLKELKQIFSEYKSIEEVGLKALDDKLTKQREEKSKDQFKTTPAKCQSKPKEK